MSDAKKPAEAVPAESMNTRWWESYLVRYFVGFIIGAVCVAVISAHLDIVKLIRPLLEPVKEGQKPGWTALVFLSAFAGLGYCYIASTPSTVLHAGRYGSGRIDGEVRYF